MADERGTLSAERAGGTGRLRLGLESGREGQRAKKLQDEDGEGSEVQCAIKIMDLEHVNINISGENLLIFLRVGLIIIFLRATFCHIKW